MTVRSRFESGPDSAAQSNLDPFGGAAKTPDPSLARPSQAHGVMGESSRWEPLGELAAGGMGVVTVVRDHWLDRNIAVKVPSREHDTQRLLHEARITASLDHPGIVAVYDTGLSASGEPWFAMRLVRGRSLADVLAEHRDQSGPAATGTPDSLLRHVLAAAEAIGYANAHGVVHRDLKPANIMVGPFGETQVIDWGLAQVADKPSPDPGRAGTALAMSPEQARGEAVDARTDVYALGAILREVATRRPLFPASMDKHEVIAAVAQNRLPALPEDTIAAELRAVIQRAMHPDKARRYPDAKALAEDLARYLDGRRVLAHAYTPTELVSRLWRAWKIPILLGLSAVAVVVATLTFAVAEVSSERDHSEHTLGRSLVAGARNALREDDRGQAEVLALAALDRGDFPEAWGVLAALPNERPGRELTDLVGCDVADVDGDTQRVLCRSPNSPDRASDTANSPSLGRLRLPANFAEGLAKPGCPRKNSIAVVDGGQTLWKKDLATQAAVFLGAGEAVLVQIDGTRLERLDARTGARLGAIEGACPYGGLHRIPGAHSALLYNSGCALVIGLDSEQPVTFDLCDEPSVRAMTIGADGQSFAAICTDGGLITGRLDVERSARFETAFAVAPERPLATAIAIIDDHHLLVGDSDGGLSLVDLERPRDRKRLVARKGLVREVHFDPTGRQALVHYESGAPYIIDVDRWASKGRLPPRETSGYRAVAFESDGRVRIGLNGRIERWDFDGVPVRDLAFREGVSDLALSSRGELVAVAHGPNLSLVDVPERRILRTQTWQSELVRTVAFDPFIPSDRPPELIAASFGERGARRVSLAGRLGFLPFELLIRRAVVLPRGGLLVSDFFRKLWVLMPDSDPVPGPSVAAQMHAMCEGRHLAILDPSATLWLRRDWELGLELQRVNDQPEAIAIGCIDDSRIFAVERFGLVELSTEPDTFGTRVRRYDSQDSDLVSGAVSRDTLAAGARDGSVWLWRRGESRAIAVVRDHDRRVDRVAFDPSGRLLVAGDWDGRLLFIDAAPELRALTSSGSALAWGLDLDALIPAR